MVGNVTENTECLACGSANIHLALNLGEQALANSFLDDPHELEAKYPLAVNLCHDCYHLQLSHTVSPEIIYKNYLYATGTNQTIRDYCEWFANWTKEYFTGTGTVLDIGCNDGTQLDYLKQVGFDTYGIDPAENLHDRSSKNHHVVCDFFGPAAVPKLNMRDYDVIVAQNVCAHNPDPHGFLASCAELMGDDTLLLVQTSQADMVLNNEFDTIYHEHVNFFNANSMKQLANRVGLNLIDVIKTPIHGTSYIFVLSKVAVQQYQVENIIALERAHGLLSVERYNVWADHAQTNINQLNMVLDDMRDLGVTLVGYGAAAKGNTLLNFGCTTLDLIIDDNPLKQGKYTPGMHIPVKSIDVLREFGAHERIAFIPLAWNFFNEIQQRILSVRNVEHDVFVRYFPEVTVQ